MREYFFLGVMQQQVNGSLMLRIEPNRKLRLETTIRCLRGNPPPALRLKLANNK